MKFLKLKNLSEISLAQLKKDSAIVAVVLLFVIVFTVFQIYIPLNPRSHEDVIFTVEISNS